jgi:hypothetical protein
MLAYQNIERDVEQALAAGVMDTKTGKILQYQQLLRCPKFHRDWTKSSANEFGRPLPEALEAKSRIPPK